MEFILRDFSLRNKQNFVFKFDMDIDTNGIHVKRIITREKYIGRNRLPLELQRVRMRDMAKAFERWYIRRLIPESRQDLDALVSHLVGEKVDNPYGTIQILSLFAYGATVTDTFWIAPANEPGVTLSLPGHPLDGRIIDYKYAYKGSCMHESRFFKACVEDGANAPSETFKYNCTDFNINGDKKKVLVKSNTEVAGEDTYFLKKYYLPKDPGEAKAFIDNLVNASKMYNDIFPYSKPLVDENGYACGYENEIFTNRFSIIYTLEDLCIANRLDLTEQNAREVLSKYGVSDATIVKIMNIKEDCFSERFYKPNTFYQNVGLLVDGESKDVLRVVAWL